MIVRILDSELSPPPLFSVLFHQIVPRVHRAAFIPRAWATQKRHPKKLAAGNASLRIATLEKVGGRQCLTPDSNTSKD